MTTCTYCQIDHQGTGKLCPKCADDRRSITKRHREKLFQAGLCIRCGKNPPRQGHKTCVCALDYLKTRADRLAKSKQCVGCAAHLPKDDTRKWCSVCRNNDVVRNQERRKQRITSGVCLRCGGDRQGNTGWCPSCRKKLRNEEQNLKLQVIAAYGGACSCCGEIDPRFLTVDHVNGGGTKHREETKGKLYRWVRNNNFPTSIQILCFNCNCGRSVNGGICPHKDQHKSST